ncbi:MAG: PadR family transcriptional regulator [Gemmatimonadales bacterium]
MAAPLSLLQGTVDMLLLKALSWGPQHGYGISQWIRARSGGTLGLEDAALYQALHRLERRGWLTAEWGQSENNRRAKYYRLTPGGRARLRDETVVWRQYAAAVFRVLDARQAEA